MINFCLNHTHCEVRVKWEQFSKLYGRTTPVMRISRTAKNKNRVFLTSRDELDAPLHPKMNEIIQTVTTIPAKDSGLFCFLPIMNFKYEKDQQTALW